MLPLYFSPVLIYFSFFPQVTDQASVVCRVKVCGKKVKLPCGHDMCRAHAKCRKIKGEFVFWDPSGCGICQGMYHSGWESESSEISANEKTFFQESLKLWVRGFKKNLPNAPYLPTVEWKDILFPNAREDAVVGRATRPQIPIVQLEMQEALDSMSLEHLEEMSGSSTLSPGREASLLQSGAEADVTGEEEEGLIPSPKRSEETTSLVDVPLSGEQFLPPPMFPLPGASTSGQSTTSTSYTPPVAPIPSEPAPQQDMMASMQSFMQMMQKQQS